ncbi:MAG: glycoside hydrolase family 1 protein [Anaerolineaceae bacterium]
MPQATYHFPVGFLWGTATSSHQVEGNNKNNNWYAWEQTPGKIINEQKSGLACDWWGGRWQEDLDRAVDNGQNAHRFSIEWSRIQPTPDHWDEHALDYYREILQGMYVRGLTPLVTLHHFTDPLWLSEQGGWENENTPLLFQKYTAKVVNALKEYVSMWVTINEPNVYAYGGYLNGGFPPGKNDLSTAFAVMANLIRGHAAAYKEIHAIQPQARVGIALNYRSFWPARSWSVFDKAIASFLFNNYNNSFTDTLVNGKFKFAFKNLMIPEAKNSQDFIGVNYYSGDLVSFKPLATKELFHKRFYRENADLSENGFIANIPKGFYESLKWARKFDKPIIVTENGVEDSKDTFRPRYMLQHLHQMWRAVNFNWPIKGYFHWSLVDNFEWERGWTQRFGLWGLDVETQTRIRRPSVDLYREICIENGISSEMVQKFAPEIFMVLFPG